MHGRREAEAKRVSQEIVNSGGTAIFVIGDLGEEANADHVAAAALSAWGGIDILVNNAGAYPGKGWFEESGDDWNAVYNTNVASMIRMINRIVPGMNERAWGRVIAIASESPRSPCRRWERYSATKAANVNLAVSLAHALPSSGVTSNAVSPGLIMTPGIDEPSTRWAPKDAAVRARMAAEMAPNPTGRAGFAQEIADAVTFLASARADYINGQNLRVDGGFVPTVNLGRRPPYF